MKELVKKRVHIIFDCFESDNSQGRKFVLFVGHMRIFGNIWIEAKLGVCRKPLFDA
jgi:hypothetical protein